MWKPQVQPRLVKARLPILSPLGGARRKQLLEGRDGEVSVGKGATSGAEAFSGGQPEAA